ncbi:hypothetical protein EDC01DRAFT_614744 [Geopyxis carbonaria]|nr:hypothetical protein EDC01DRAFT_614744 [Geopyxis carbonaria]
MNHQHAPLPFEDAQLQISHEELSYIAHTQQSLGGRGGGAGGGSPSSSRRPSTSSSVGAMGGASISLEPRALAQLSAHFDGLLQAITSRVENLSQQTLKSTNAYHRRANNVSDHATMEIERLREIMRQCDELQIEFLKIKRIGEIVKGFRQRVETLEQRIGR